MWLFLLCWLTSLFWVIIRYLYTFACFIRNIHYWLRQKKWRPHLKDGDMFPGTLSGYQQFCHLFLIIYNSSHLFVCLFLKGNERLKDHIIFSEPWIFIFWGRLRLPLYKVCEWIQLFRKAKCSLGSISCLKSLGSVYLPASTCQYLYSYFCKLTLIKVHNETDTIMSHQ